jgi:hypothetical protein
MENMLQQVSANLGNVITGVVRSNSIGEMTRNAALTAIKGVIRQHGNALIANKAPVQSSLNRMSLLSKLAKNGTQDRSVVTDSMHATLKKVIPHQINVDPDVPVTQSSGACDAYASKVLKGYAKTTSDGVAKEEPPRSLLDKLRIMFEGNQNSFSGSLDSGAKLHEEYMTHGPFILKGPGLATTYYPTHAMPVMAVVSVEVDGQTKTALIAIDRNDCAEDKASEAVWKLAADKGMDPSEMPQAVLNQHPELRDEFDKSCIRLIDADAALKHTKETHAHFEEKGANMPGPATEFLKSGLKPITPQQENALKSAIIAAYKNGDVETYSEYDYSLYAHNKKKMMK